MSSHHHLFKYLRQKENQTKVDHLMLVASAISPMTMLPQVIQVYSTKNVDGLSLVTWLAGATLGLIFLAYGISHRLKLYVFMQILWQIVDVLLIVGIIIYG